MKDELTAAWEDLATGGDWTCLGRELLAGASGGVSVEEKEASALEGSPPPGGGSRPPAFEADSDMKGNGGCRGVYFDHIRHLWRANWPEETIVMDRESKRPIEVRRCTRTKGFSAKKFGFQESKRMAVAHRKTMITSGVIRKYIYQEGGAAASSSNTGLKKLARDKKRRKVDKTMTAQTPPCYATTASTVSSPTTETTRDDILEETAQEGPAPPSAAAAALDLMLCLDPQSGAVPEKNATGCSI